ncbi:ATP-binding protein [Desulforudis sp. 1031]
MRSVTLVPSAQRLMESLRDLGYDLPTAIADLVDNSIEADATEVRIDFHFAGTDSWIRIADNGRGMSPPELDEALRYGTRRSYDERHLGRFGLGLKTASLSQCQCLTVATRAREEPERIEVRRWDLAHVGETDSWDALKLDVSECRTECVEPLKETSGVVVFWERLDRILNYRDPSGGWAKEGFARLCRNVEEHLAMVFHRFLSGEARRTLPLNIFINGNPVKPWDPFARSEPATQSLGSQKLFLRGAGRTLSVTVRSYVLPSEAQFSSARAREAASGPKKWNRQQGFYIYRADRMIQSGGWNRLRTLDEHTKLARIAIDFSPMADAAFRINVAKMSVQLPDEIRNSLAAIASAVVARAKEAYRSHGTAPPGRSGGSRAGSSTGSRDVERTTPKSTTPSEYEAESQPADRRLARSVITVLKRELAEHPELLSRVLSALAELSADFLPNDAGRDDAWE